MGQAVRDADGTILWVDGTISDITDVKHLETDLRVAQRLEAVGQLAAGHRARDQHADAVRRRQHPLPRRRRSTTSTACVAEYRALCTEAAAAPLDEPPCAARIEAAEDAADLEYLRERVPAALDRTLEGVGRVATIVAAMKEFAPARPGRAGARRPQRRARSTLDRRQQRVQVRRRRRRRTRRPAAGHVQPRRAQPGLPQPRRQRRPRDRGLRRSGRASAIRTWLAGRRPS